MKQKDRTLLILGILGFFALVYFGYINLGGGKAIVGGQGSGVCNLQSGTTDYVFTTTDSIPDSQTHAVNLIAGTAYLYRPGSNYAFSTVPITSSGAASSSTDPNCGESGLKAYVNSTTSYYPRFVDITAAGNVASYQVAPIALDPISTITLAMYNTTATGSKTSTPMHEKLAASTPATLRLAIDTDAKKVLHKPMVGFYWVQTTSGAAADASANESVTMQGWTSTPCGFGGSGFSGYTDCFVYPNDLSNAQVFETPVYVEPGANFGLINATVQVVDLGVDKVDGVQPILFAEYSNPTSGARPTYSATAVTFAIQFNS